jgi:hypothetical protein
MFIGELFMSDLLGGEEEKIEDIMIHKPDTLTFYRIEALICFIKFVS